MYLADVFTVSANLVGLPAISVPCGMVERSEGPERSERLPVGLQLTGRLFDESTLLQAADAYERLTDWHTQRPT
jgi:aspartyl-tRNA(Asn)/glutamyl-tRNA(Gln) amidotransferase subunit A